MKKYLETTPAAAYLTLRPQTLRARRQRGDGPAFIRVARNRILYDIETLDAFLRERTFTSTAEAQKSSLAAKRVTNGSALTSGTAPRQSLNEPEIRAETGRSDQTSHTRHPAPKRKETPREA